MLAVQAGKTRCASNIFYRKLNYFKNSKESLILQISSVLDIVEKIPLP